MTEIRKEFDVHLLNEGGIGKAKEIGMAFTAHLDRLEYICGTEGREMSIVRTKLQEAAFFAKRAMAVKEENQVAAPSGPV